MLPVVQVKAPVATVTPAGWVSTLTEPEFRFSDPVVHTEKGIVPDRAVLLCDSESAMVQLMVRAPAAFGIRMLPPAHVAVRFGPTVIVTGGVSAESLPSLTVKFAVKVPAVANVFVTVSPVAVVLSLNLHEKVSGSSSGSLDPVDRIVKLVRPAMPVAVGETVIVPGDWRLVLRQERDDRDRRTARRGDPHPLGDATTAAAASGRHLAGRLADRCPQTFSSA